ncbi:MAG: aminotransferase class I/II-fold pyridoxal phosphate-dependent enzyme [Roseiflexaceae bacterium]|nr:aminotransferase class I/II-fold pyridoxal phosphate-dependent enzyme [Roseiflexus sp.]MDW8231329.1 aminotransferase class I/II-fold pyridoxal phosphate-dependent enzyme [Roseiflexaceae bacterium]
MTRPRIARRMDRIPASGIRRFFDIAAHMPDVISLGVGEPDFVTPAPIRAAGIRSLEEGRTGYTSNAGLPELRMALSDHLYARYGVRYDPETELLITVGVSEALHVAAIATLNPGDEVIIPEPCFVAYPAAVIVADAEPIFVPTTVDDSFQVDPARIAAAITPRTRAILLGYPNNPTGAVMPRERLSAIAELAERHDLLVFSDEIYDRLVYGVQHTCFASLPGARERTILLGGFSKAYAMTGWRLGWMAAPADIVAAARRVHQYAIMSAPTAAQYAGIEALRNGESFVADMAAEYDRRRRLIVAGLNAIGLPTFEPQGAFYVFPQVAHLGMSSEVFAERLLREQRVAVIPGDTFGPSGAGFVRACYAASMEKIKVALERIERFVRANTS